MRFANPEFIIIFSVIILLVFLYKRKNLNKFFKSFIRFPIVYFLENKEQMNFKNILLQFLKVLKLAVLILIILATARPQEGRTFEETKDQGIDIMIALDTSTSMSALDFKPLNRMETAKKVIEGFVKERKSDRIGLVVFSGLAFTQSPLTTDKDSLAEFVQGVNIGDTGVDGTALGSAIMTSINRLKNSETKSKVIILVTDGNNNMGEVDPVTAARAAEKYGIKLYTIGVGSHEGAIYEVDGFFGKRQIRSTEDKINEDILKEMAHITGGKYFRAADMISFENIMQEIDRLEKDEIKNTEFTVYNELYKKFLIPTFILLLFIILSENTYLRRLP